MTPNLLILGGTSEATALAKHLAQLGLRANMSLAGRVAQPKTQALPVRIGGFGGAQGLRAYLDAEVITHVIDATHPFAAQMSQNAVGACAQAGVPLVALTRAAWTAQPGDVWHHVPDIRGAVAALNRPPSRVFLAVGRMHLDAFVPVAHHDYLLRLVDPPDTSLPLPRAQVIVDRGPFDMARDLAVLRDHRIELVVSKNAGGTGAIAKIQAARELQIPVLMIDRPVLPPRDEVHSVEAVLAWLQGHDADLGV